MENRLDGSYTLGLDVGSSSIGWAVMDPGGEKLIRIGVRKFNEPREPKSYSSLAAIRRANRSQRRTIRRRALRQRRLMALLREEKVISVEEERASLRNNADVNNIFYQPQGKKQPSPWQLRAEGLHRKLERTEWARVLVHLSKHRGYQSNAIERARVKDKKNYVESDKEKLKQERKERKERGKLLAGIDAMKSRLEEFVSANPGSPHTIGEMIYIQNPDRKRNTSGEYLLTVGREELIEELRILFKEQERLHNPHAQDDFLKRVEEIINSRRSYARGPGGDSPYGGDLIARMVGNCTLDKNEKRAPKDSWTATMFRLHQSINNLRWGSYVVHNTAPTREQREAILERAQSLFKLSYKQIRELLDLPDSVYFKGLRYDLGYREIHRLILIADDNNYYKVHIKGKRDIIPRIAAAISCQSTAPDKNKIYKLKTEFKMPEKMAKSLVKKSKNPESRVFLDRQKLGRIENTLKDNKQEYTPRDLDEIVQILATFKDEDACTALVECGYQKDIARLLCLEAVSGFTHLSVKTMSRLIPHLARGLRYDQACTEEGFNHAQAQLDRTNVNNPTVFRAFKQCQKLIAALKREYGTPREIRLEVARDINRSKEERNRLDNEMKGNEAVNREMLEEFRRGIGRLPQGREAQIWRLYNEQNGKCLYCGNSLGSPSEIFGSKGAPTVELEHTLPYARSLDNRQCNKTAACISCNKEKGNRTPFEFLGGDETSERWREFKARCNHLKDPKKRELLIITDWDEKTDSMRALSDTRYITRMLQSWLESSAIFDGELVSTPAKGERRSIFAIKGGVTSLCRRLWQLERLKYSVDGMRETEKNHALDAAVVAAASNRMLQLISDESRKSELYDKTDREHRVLKKIQTILEQPWPTFARELMALYGYRDGAPGFDHDPNDSMALIEGAAEKYGITEENRPLKPVFVSWMPQRGVKGQVHEETIHRIREVQDPETGEQAEWYFKRIPLTKLKSAGLEKMAGAYDSATREPTPMYRILKKRLDDHDDDPKKAFAEPVRKGNKPDAPIIRGVRIREKIGGAFHVQGGAAANGSIIRVDIFRRKDKKGVWEYYLVPVYTKHRTSGSLPMKAVLAHKLEEEWETMRSEEFWCSLYPKDYVRVEKDKGVEEGYYTSMDRDSAKIELHPHDSKSVSPVAVKRGVKSIEKFEVDLLGNRHRVRLPEKRVPLSRPGQRG